MYIKHVHKDKQQNTVCGNQINTDVFANNKKKDCYLVNNHVGIVNSIGANS